jgi:HdeA/HdeB family
LTSVLRSLRVGEIREEPIMSKTLAAAAFAILCVAVIPGQAAPQAAPAADPAAPPSAATAASPVADAQVAPGKWDVERVRCSDLLDASDDDRESAAMFYYGYLAAKADIHVIDVSKISDNLGKVMEQCSATPGVTVPQAFRDALAPRQ